MTSSAVDGSQRSAARVAAVVYLLSFALVVAVNFGIFGRLLRGGPPEMAQNILAHETFFRVGLVGQLLY